jgi:hypothetical protein
MDRISTPCLALRQYNLASTPLLPVIFPITPYRECLHQRSNIISPRWSISNMPTPTHIILRSQTPARRSHQHQLPPAWMGTQPWMDTTTTSNISKGSHRAMVSRTLTSMTMPHQVIPYSINILENMNPLLPRPPTPRSTLLSGRRFERRTDSMTLLAKHQKTLR